MWKWCKDETCNLYVILANFTHPRGSIGSVYHHWVMLYTFVGFEYKSSTLQIWLWTTIFLTWDVFKGIQGYSNSNTNILKWRGTKEKKVHRYKDYTMSTQILIPNVQPNIRPYDASYLIYISFNDTFYIF